MSDNRVDIKALISKLEAYKLEDDNLLSEEIDLFTSWVKSNPSGALTVNLLGALQHYGVNTPERARLFTGTIFRCFTETNNTDVAYTCLYNLSDSLYYEEGISSDVIIWALGEKRRFNKSSRAYKLAKSDFLAKVLTQKSCRDQWVGVRGWIKFVIANYDDEYVDLLAFALTNNEVDVPRNVRECFKNYLQNNPSTEAKEEITKLLVSA